MNFFTIGVLFLLFQLNLGWASNYVVKLIGFLLFLVGLGEIEQLCRIQRSDCKRISLTGFNLNKSLEKLMSADAAQKEGVPSADECSMRLAACELIKRNAFACTGVCAVSALCMLICRIFKLSGVFLNVVSLLLGTAVTLISLELCSLVLRFIESNEKKTDSTLRFLNDRSLTFKLRSAFNKTAVCTLVNLCCDILNRIIPLTGVQSFFGFMAAVSKVTLYVFIIITVYNFNLLRADCDKKYDKDNE